MSLADELQPDNLLFAALMDTAADTAEQIALKILLQEKAT